MQPEKVQAFIIQNGNAYYEGLGEFWNPIKIGGIIKLWKMKRNFTIW
jgi:hypothetical protein